MTLALPTPRETLYRSYSLCGGGDPSEPWELTIKRVDQGAVSNYFYDKVVAGTLLYASLPRGVFTLPGNLHAGMVLTMMAVGSGVTPIMGMLRAIDRMRPDERPSVQFYYASRTPEDIILVKSSGRWTQVSAGSSSAIIFPRVATASARTWSCRGPITKVCAVTGICAARRP